MVRLLLDVSGVESQRKMLADRPKAVFGRYEPCWVFPFSPERFGCHDCQEEPKGSAAGRGRKTTWKGRNNSTMARAAGPEVFQAAADQHHGSRTAASRSAVPGAHDDQGHLARVSTNVRVT